MDICRLRDLAGIEEDYTQSDLDSEDISRLDYLLKYYIDGWGGFPDHPDAYTKKVMDAIQHLQGRNLYQLTPEESKMAQKVLIYGADV